MRRLFITGLALLLLVSCAKETEPGSPGDATVVRLKVALPSENVKTSLAGLTEEGKYPVLWSRGDRISINGSFSSEIEAEDAGGREAEFSFEDDLTAPFNILYPAVNSTDEVTFPPIQQYTEGTFAPCAAPMWAVGAGFSDVTMKHLTSVLRFCFTGHGETVRYIRVSTRSGAPVSGRFKMEKDESGRFTGDFSAQEGASSSILLDCGEGIILSGEPSYFYMTVPHGIYEGGFNAQLITASGQSMKLAFFAKEGDETLNPAKLLRFQQTDFVSGGNVMLISTPADLLAFADSALNYDEAALTADIDMSGQDFVSIDSFEGRFDGAGYTISGLEKPLFTSISGELCNLRINTSAKVTEQNGFACFAGTLAAGGTISSCTLEGKLEFSLPSSTVDMYCAGIVAYNKGTVSNCTNNADITVTEAVNCSTNRFVVSGVVALQNAAGARVSGCVNTGTLKAKQTLSTNPVFAGVVGNVTAGTVGNCTNLGVVEVMEGATATANWYVGGVVSVSSVPISGCINKGTVAFYGGSKAATSYSYAGGVVGTISAQVSDCSMEGTFIYAPASQNNPISYAGGVVGRVAAVSGNPAVSITGLSAGEKATVDIHVPAGTYANGLSSAVYAGGVIGGIVCLNTALTACSNAAAFTVHAEGDLTQIMAGGVIGAYVQSGANVFSMENLTNSGEITLTGASKCGTDLTKRNYVGGIAGRIYSTSTSSCEASSCVNTGKVTLNLDGEALSERTYVAGLFGTARIYSFSVKNCRNEADITVNGSCNDLAMAGILALALRDENASTVSISGCENRGRIGLYEDGKCGSPCTAGGILGLAISGPLTTGKMLTLNVSDCTNNAPVDRLVSSYSKAVASFSYGGGIIGNLGYDSSNDASIQRNYITADVVHCTNNAQIIFNQYVGPDSYVENAYGWSYSGGIVGFSSCRGGYGLVRACTNNGNIWSTSGTMGGILGSAYAATSVLGIKTAEGVEYTKNNGMVYLRSETASDLQMFGHTCAGGIVGELRRTGNISGTSNNGQSYLKIEYCWNDGYVGGCSESASYGTGGIVGRQYWGGTAEPRVLHCKNSGAVRALRNAAGTATTYNGAISGTYTIDNVDRNVAFCAVGGRLARYNISNGTWFDLEPLGGTRAFNKYIYPVQVTEEKLGDLAPGCTFWDGTSPISWETE